MGVGVTDVIVIMPPALRAIISPLIAVIIAAIPVRIPGNVLQKDFSSFLLLI